MRHAVLVVWLAGGCGDVVKAAMPDAPSAVDAAAVDAPLSDAPPTASTCNDTFEDGTLDPTLWALSDLDNTPIVISETAGRLRVTVPSTPSSSSAGVNLLVSKRPFTFAGSTTQAHVVTVPVDAETQTVFVIADSTIGVGFTMYGNTFPRAQVGATSTSVNHADRHWRIREAAGTAYVESSADGLTTWTVRHMGPTPAMTNPQIKIGSALDTGPGGILEVDNLVTTVATGACPLH